MRHPAEPLFDDRREAGRLLGVELRRRHVPGVVVVIGLARGGVVVAAEVADALDAPLDVLAVRKVGHPFQREYAIGAVTPGGGLYLRAGDGSSDALVAEVVVETARKAEALDARLHAGRPRLDVAGRTAILVDDGLATGATMLAAIRWAREGAARRVVVAVPFGAAGTVDAIRDEADELVCLYELDDLGAVGLWYHDFTQVTDRDVVALLSRRARATSLTPSGR